MKTLLFVFCLPIFGLSQNTIGFPDVVNYSKQAYNAGLQNWDIKQDRNGIIYVANNEGLLAFDGIYWNLYPLPNKTIVRSVEIGSDGRIYVGGQDELGYFSPSTNGELSYHSLTSLIPLKDKSFGDVWDIIALKKDIFLRSQNKIFRLTNDAVATFNAQSEWTYLGYCNGELLAHDYTAGLMHFANGIFVPLPVKNLLPVNDPVTSLLPIAKDSILISTLKNGLYLLSNNTLSKLPSPNNILFENERIYGATLINNNWIALATNNSGIYITDTKGNIIQSFSGKEGLQNNNVLSIYLDNQGNLWLGLDNGIDLINYNSAIKQIKPVSQNGSGYTAAIFNKRLFLGTSNGLYNVSLDDRKDLSFCKGNFEPVLNTKGQVWNLTEINNQLLLGHHDGAFTIDGNMARPLSSRNGFWNFIPMSGTFPTAQIIAGNYKGLSFFNYASEQFAESATIPDFDESARFVAIDKDDNIWVSHPYHGVYKLIKNINGTYITSYYTEKKGLPSLLNNHVYKIKNEVVVATERGIYNYNAQADHFELSTYYNKYFGNQSIRYLKEDQAGNIWFIHEKSLGVLDFSGKDPVIIYLPELTNKLLSGFEFIYPVNDNNIFIGAEKGFFHINYEKYKEITQSLKVQIRTVRIINTTDSLLFGGYYKNVNEIQQQDTRSIPEIDNHWKTIRFEFSSTLFGYQSNLEYSYRLKGFETNWSEWTKRTEKEFNNLRAGKYTLEVKVRNNLGNESAIASFSFKVLPPWYQTSWAIVLYLLLIAATLYLLYRWQQKKFTRQQQKYEEEQKRLLYIHELELSKSETELVTLRNEKLEAEIHFKNSELASSAMHLVKKGELLSKLKTELSHVMKGYDNQQPANDLKKIIKSLSDDDNLDKEWENFTKHFDKIHGDFVAGLKEKHPNITGNELKLCAYLRMNLSTKEIAQLMNISIRGVEISRYRLRKKLQIPSEKNLFDYLINLQNPD